MRKRFRLGTGFAAGLLSLTALFVGIGAVAADSTVVVKSNDLQGWQIIPDGTVPYAFVAGPASIGSGSLQFGPIAAAPGANKFIAVAPVTGLVADLTSFSYDFYIDAASPGGVGDANHFYLNIYVDSAANGIGTVATFYDCRYDSVPSVGAVGAWSTHTVTQGSTWTNVASPLAGCPSTLGALPPGSKILFVVLNGGQSNSSDAGLQGGYDKVVVTSPSGATTYDFEPLVGPPTNKDQCKDGGWSSFDLPRKFKNQGDCIQFVNTGK